MVTIAEIKQKQEELEQEKRWIEKRLAILHLKELAGCYEPENVEDAWAIEFDGYNGDFYSRYGRTFNMEKPIYFKSDDEAEKAIDTLGEEKLKLIFDIEG